MELYRTIFLQRISNGIELLSAVVLLVGFAKGMWGFLRHEWAEMRSPAEASPEGVSRLRPMVGHYILLGLDFYIVSDLVSAMLHPEWMELVSLVVIGLLRTAIGYFLGKELVEQSKN